MSLYKQSPEGLWWVNITHPGAPRIRQSTGTTDRKEAQRYHDELKASLWSSAPKLKGRTWGIAVMKWVEKEPRSDSEILSLVKFGRIYKDRLITKVDRESVHEALSFCKTAGTYTRYRTMIMAILNVAKDEGWLRDVPKLATRTDKKTATRDWITHEQWDKLYAELPPHLKPMAAFAVQTGLRQANVLGLTWDRVDLGRGHVTVEGVDSKSGRAISVPLSEGAYDTLVSQIGKSPQWVFTFRGKPIKDVKTAFIAACIRAGLGAYISAGEAIQRQDRPMGRAPRYVGFTWHGLRHTWATWHIQNGTPIEVLQQLGGWSDLRMVLLYAHHTPGFLASFVENGAKK